MSASNKMMPGLSSTDRKGDVESRADLRKIRGKRNPSTVNERNRDHDTNSGVDAEDEERDDHCCDARLEADGREEDLHEGEA